MNPRAFAKLVAALLLLGGAWLAIAWLTSPRPGMENYVRVSAKDSYFARPGDRKLLGGGAVMVTFLGSTTLLFDDGKTQFLIDGFLTRPGMIRSLRVRTDSAVVDAALATAGVDAARLKAVFVSHSHYDHAMDVAYIVNRYPGSILYGSRSTHQLGCGAQIAESRNRVVKGGDEIALGGAADDFVITVLDSLHSPDPKFPGVIDECLAQSAWVWNYKEGGSFDFLIRHGEHSMLFKAGANVLAPLEGRIGEIEVLFLSTGLVGEQVEPDRKQYFKDTVSRLRPRLVIPMHWDDFFAPLSVDLEFSIRVGDNSPRAFDALLAQVSALNSEPGGAPPVEFRLLQGYDSVVLFRPPQSRSQ